MKIFLQIILLAIFLTIFLVPGYTFFITNQNSTKILFESNIDTAEYLYTLFRLFGLYAFTLVWGQIILGPFMGPLRRLYGSKIYQIHRVEGIFALLFASLHPLIFYLAFLFTPKHGSILGAISNYLGGGDLSMYGYIGPVVWTLMIITVTTAILANQPWLINRWRTVHLLNYVVFMLAFVHSFKIGTEVQLDPLKSLYLFFALTFILAVGYRILYKRIWAKITYVNKNLSRAKHNF